MDALIFYFYLIVKCTVKKCCVNGEILFLFVFFNISNQLPVFRYIHVSSIFDQKVVALIGFSFITSPFSARNKNTLYIKQLRNAHYFKIENRKQKLNCSCATDKLVSTNKLLIFLFINSLT